jgi:hypothetical protein
MELEGYMDSLDNTKVSSSSFVMIGDQKISAEKLLLEDGREKIRLVVSQGDNKISDPILLSETDLLELLHQAIIANVLPRNFIGKLRERMEI